MGYDLTIYFSEKPLDLDDFLKSRNFTLIESPNNQKILDLEGKEVLTYHFKDYKSTTGVSVFYIQSPPLDWEIEKTPIPERMKSIDSYALVGVTTGFKIHDVYKMIENSVELAKKYNGLLYNQSSNVVIDEITKDVIKDISDSLTKFERFVSSVAEIFHDSVDELLNPDELVTKLGENILYKKLRQDFSKDDKKRLI